MNDLKNIENLVIVLFNLDEQHYALNIPTVEIVVPIVDITPLPEVSEIVKGIVNFHGEVIKVINIRRLFNLPVREIELDDQLIIASISSQRVALVVDSVTGIHELEHKQLTGTGEAFSDYLSGIAMVENNIVMIIDEQKVLEQAINTS